MPYQVASNSKLEEIHGKSEDCCFEEKVGAFSDSDWAGDDSHTERRQRSVSSGVVFCQLQVGNSLEQDPEINT